MYRTSLTILFLLFLPRLEAQTFNAELLEQNSTISIKNGKLKNSESFKIRINNRAGEDYAQVQLPSSKAIKLSNLEAYLTDDHGKMIKRLKKDEIIKRSAISDFSLFEDDYLNEFTLKHNVYPYQLHYSYDIAYNEFLSIADWQPVIHYKVPTHKAKLELTVPSDYLIHTSEQFTTDFKMHTSGGENHYVWEASYYELVKHQVLAPKVYNFLPMVRIVPQSFFYVTSGGTGSWQEFGDWQYKLMDGLSDLSEVEKNKIQELTEGIEDNYEKVRILYHYLQDVTRYINVSIDAGGLKPYPASYVASNKYGDCKALSNYFISMLECIGVKAYYSKVYAGNPSHKINTAIPGQQFNHIILNIPMQKDTLWLDCTSNMAYGYIGTFTQNRLTLVVDQGNSKLKRTPVLCPEDVLETRTVKVIQEFQNQASVDFYNIYKGDTYEDLFSINHAYSKEDKARIIRNYFKEEGFDLIDFSIVPLHRDSARIDVLYKMKSSLLFKKYGNETLVRVLPFSIPEFEKPENRKLPVQLDFPISKTDTMYFDFLDSSAVEPLFEDIEVETDYGLYSIQYKYLNKQAIVVKKLTLFSGYIPLEEYNAFYAFVKQIIKLDKNAYLQLL